MDRIKAWSIMANVFLVLFLIWSLFAYNELKVDYMVLQINYDHEVAMNEALINHNQILQEPFKVNAAIEVLQKETERMHELGNLLRDDHESWNGLYKAIENLEKEESKQYRILDELKKEVYGNDG